MDGRSPRSALEELLRRGTARARTGLDELTRRLWQRRREIQRRHRLDGTLQRVRRLLDEALEAERRALFPDPSDDARFREAQLDALPSGTGGRRAGAGRYDWQSAEAREKYEEIRDLLGRELLDQRFEGMKQALQKTTPEDVERIQRDADRPQRAARRARAGRRTRRSSSTSSWQARRVLPGEPAQHRGADRRAGRRGRPRRSG